LPMSLTELIHLSFGAVNLTVPPDTYSIFRSCTLWLVKWDSRRNEQQDRGHILSKHIAGLSEEQGERNGYLGMGYFRSTSCIEHATPQCFFFFKFSTHITVSVTSFSKGGGEIGTTFFGSFVLGINILTRGSLGGGVLPLPRLVFSWNDFLPMLRASITGVCVYQDPDDGYCQGIMMTLQDAPAVLKSAIGASCYEHVIMGT